MREVKSATWTGSVVFVFGSKVLCHSTECDAIHHQGIMTNAMLVPGHASVMFRNRVEMKFASYWSIKI